MRRVLQTAARIPARESEVEAMVEAHLAQVRIIAWKLVRGRARVEMLEDAIQEGVLGLIEAARRFDGERGVQFSTYAEHRIRGAILDGMRRMGRRRTAAERERDERERAAEQIGMTIAEMQELEEELGGGQGVSEAVATRSVPAAEPLEELLAREARARVRSAMGELPERERGLLTRHYLGEVPLREAGRELRVSEARVSQLHRRGLASLRAKLCDERR